MTGGTSSSDFPTTAGAFDSSHNGYSDAFVTKLSSDGSTLVYATFLGGSGVDGGRGIALDTAGNAYVAGTTDSSNFPTTPEAFDTSFNGVPGRSDAFVAMLSSDGSALLYSTFMGGVSNDYGQGIALDATGNVFVTGETSSSDFPTTAGAFDTSLNGSDDAFVFKLSSDGSMLLYSTFLGGSSEDWGRGIALDRAGNVYVTGHTWSPDFPTTVGAFDMRHNGGLYDAFVAKLSLPGPPTLTLTDYAYITTMENTLKVIRTSDNTVVTTVGVGTNPQGVAATPDGAFVYVANRGSDNVSVIRTSDWSPVTLIPVGSRPWGMAITPDGAFAYATNTESNNVSVIRTSDNVVAATVPVGITLGRPNWLGNLSRFLDPQVSGFSTCNPLLRRISRGPKTGKRIGIILGLFGHPRITPVGMAISPDGAFAYVTNYSSYNISVIRVFNNTVVATISVGIRPYEVAITPNGDFAYVTNNGSNNISVIRTSDNTVVSMVAVGSNPIGIAITPDGASAYVANFDSNNVLVIRTSDNTILTTVSVGTWPYGVAITPDGVFVYVTTCIREIAEAKNAFSPLKSRLYRKYNNSPGG